MSDGSGRTQAAALLAVLELEERKPDVFVGQTPSTGAPADLRRSGRRPGADGRGPDRPRRAWCALAALVLPPPRGSARGDPLRGRPHPGWPVVHHPSRRRLAGTQGRGRRHLRADRGLPRGHKAVAEHSLPMPDVPAPETLPGTAEIVATHRGPGGMDGRDGPGRRAAVPGGPVRGRAQVAAGHEVLHLVPGRR